MKRKMHKYMFSAAIAFPLSWLVETMRYVYQDWEFAKWIAMAIVIDTALGLVNAWIKKDISSEEFWRKFSKKIFVYICLLILSNVLQNYTINGSTVGATEWIGSYLCTFMLVREAISILENTNSITPIVPKWVLERMRYYIDHGKDSEEPEKEEEA